MKACVWCLGLFLTLITLPFGPTGVELSVESDKCLKEFPEVFTACAVTRALARAQVEGSSGVPVTLAKGFIPVLPAPLSVDGVIEAQKEDATLEGCFAMIVDDQGVEHDCFVQDGLPLGGVPCIQAPDMRESGGEANEVGSCLLGGSDVTPRSVP
ncbi:unnamed protein product [Boreogadus saida]